MKSLWLRSHNSSFLLRFSYYKSAVRNKCFPCDLILCRHKHLGSTHWLGGLDCLESRRDLINLSCYKEKGFTCSLSSFTALATALWMMKETMNLKRVIGPELGEVGRAQQKRKERWGLWVQMGYPFRKRQFQVLIFSMPPHFKKLVI